jgi:hypothetical protein
MGACFNASLASDRFNNPNLALYLNNGYCAVPPGVYFNGPYTITAWIKVVKANYMSRLLDFGKGKNIDNVIVALSFDTTSKPYLANIQGSNWRGQIIGGSPIPLGVWTHLATVFDGSQGYVYLNGNPTGSTNMESIDNVLRTSCFIGRSNWYAADPDLDANAYFDDIKIYNRNLSPQEIVQDMN